MTHYLPDTSEEDRDQSYMTLFEDPLLLEEQRKKLTEILGALPAFDREQHILKLVNTLNDWSQSIRSRLEKIRKPAQVIVESLSINTSPGDPAEIKISRSLVKSSARVLAGIKEFKYNKLMTDADVKTLEHLFDFIHEYYNLAVDQVQIMKPKQEFMRPYRRLCRILCTWVLDRREEGQSTAFEPVYAQACQLLGVKIWDTRESGQELPPELQEKIRL